MAAPTTPAFTPARLAAIALVGLAVLGLSYLRFAPSDAVSVPKGAHAGRLALKPCTYETEQGGYAADCGTLVVPENRADPGSRLIALPVTRIRARTPHPAEPVFRLEGGPGLTNMSFAQASRLAGRHDVVLVGYRGVDGSVRLDCPEVESALSHSTGLLGAKSMDAYADGFRACAARLERSGVDLAGYSLVQTVEDLEAARRALGYDRIDLVSESAGTRTALIYGWRHPSSIHRSAMIGVNPPGHFLWDGRAIDAQLARYSELCSRDETCSRRTGDLAASMKRTAADLPGRWLFLPIDRDTVRVASFYGLMESTSAAAPLSGPLTLGSWLSAAKGDASGFWLQSLLGRLVFPKSFVWGELAAMGRADAAAAKRHFATRAHDGSIIGNPGTDFVWAGGRLADAWPATPDEREYSRVRPSNVETLLVGGELDGTTPPAVAKRELLPYLPRGRQVVLSRLGHTEDFWSYEPDASSHLLNTFFDTGRADASRYTPAHVDWTPNVTQTAIAKIVAGAMVGLAALALSSLALMALRVRRRPFGRKASALLRSVYPLVLGLGGWLAGVLVVLTALPGVALDGELLAALSVGVPVGLGVYLAWVNRGWSGGTRAIGLAASAGGALVGAWLGFHAAGDLLALVTSIVGATAGANLALLGLDVAWDRQARDRYPRLKAETMLVVPGSPAWPR